ncbi:MAG: alanine--tRNA ligase [Puniceicoccales bacterium]|jgi:alanyl-tRNA synthetase|nr:alanine--tRNA ligase [Puniceicoccales bacterium]
MDSSLLRQSFFDFFKSKGHALVSSSSLRPEAPNLLFTNAGMNQFVPYLLGERTPDARRVVDTQKCMRAGGKHNDLDDVGFDTYHHTFFEMLGNWSFGDFFKEEIIGWAWELLVHLWKFPKNRLYATVYRPQNGDPAEFDSASYEVWKNIFLGEGLDPDVHIKYGGKSENFWMMGNTGPCGPCSEIHMDLTPNGDTNGELVNGGDVRCMELWNLVFMQFNALNDGTFESLPQFNVDTGMGLERVVGIVSKTKNFTDFSRLPSNYDSDLFADIFQAIGNMCGQKYGGSLPSSREKMTEGESVDFAFRAIADHIRALTFAVADGIFPSNEGRGYVLRRILRRAVTFCHNLGLKAGSFAELSRVVVKKMGKIFGELSENGETAHRVICSEEIAFNRTLERGMGILNDLIAGAENRIISGQDAFLLYDTYGFPLDLTQLIARNNGCQVDTAVFEGEMEKQRERARSAQKKIEICLNSGPSSGTEFIGYDANGTQNVPCTILEVIGEGNYLILDKTPFYAECGGQVSDRGTIHVGELSFTVTSVLRDKNGQILHKIAENVSKNLGGSKASASIDRRARLASARNHTATHILHWALRNVLGAHVKQAGSCVDSKRLRFDFNHFEAVSQENLAKVERLVQDKILEGSSLSIFETKFNEKPEDCIANFGEKYGDIVRVVRIGNYSSELCGGCHVVNTSEICFFKILGESSISSGIRRIEAVSGEEAINLANVQFANLANLAKIFSCKSDDVAPRVSALLGKVNRLETEVKAARNSLLLDVAANLAAKANALEGDIYGINERVSGFSTDEVRSMAASLAKKFAEHVIVLTGEKGGKSTVVAMCSAEARALGYNAGSMVKEICVKHGGNGGGNGSFAMGGF